MDTSVCFTKKGNITEKYADNYKTDLCDTISFLLSFINYLTSPQTYLAHTAGGELLDSNCILSIPNYDLSYNAKCFPLALKSRIFHQCKNAF